MEEIVILGAGGHGKVVIDIVEKMGRYRILGLVDNSPEKLGREYLGYRVIANEDGLSALSTTLALVAVGDNFSRRTFIERVIGKAPGLNFVTAIHPSAQIGRDVEIGAGTVIMAGATINSGTRIGRHCIVNTQGSLDHDCILGDYSSLAPGAICGGNVTLGAGASINLGASVIHGITIGEHAVVGAGAVVLEDVPPRVVSYGVPSRVVRARAEGDRYL